MTYVVTDNCIKCKYMDCIEVCPVDCFYEGENMLVIHPDECIDCGVCEPECPADAIKPDTEPGLEKWLQVNTEYAEKWPNITAKKEPPADAKEFDGVDGKFEKYFSAEARRRRLTAQAADWLQAHRRCADHVELSCLDSGSGARLRACSKSLILATFCANRLTHADDTTSINGAEAANH